MSSRNNLISEEIRKDILARSLFAASKKEVTQAIFEAIVEAGIDWRTVSVEDVKPVLADALRAFLGRPFCFEEPLAI